MIRNILILVANGLFLNPLERSEDPFGAMFSLWMVTYTQTNYMTC